MTSSRFETVRRVAAFGAHPDDLEVGAGGLIARLAMQGADVAMVVGSVPNQPAQRRAEATAGAARLGGRLVLPPGDGATRLEDVSMHELVGRFDGVIADVRPELVIVHGEHDSHWDHTLVHRAVLAALRRTTCDVIAFATRLPVGAAAPRPTCIADVSSTIDRKIAAIAEHVSQFPPGFAETRRDIARAAGASHGVAYAEVFEALRILV